MTEEIWKDITGYDNYKISSMGNIRNILTNKLLKPFVSCGYYNVNLYKNKVSKGKTIHRLVATSFINNIENKPVVNHKDGNKLNNDVSNLEWVTASENVKHSYDTKLKKSFTLEVEQYSMDGTFIKSFSSITEASKNTGCDEKGISSNCKGNRRYTGGFIWKYKYPVKKIEEKDVDGVDIKGYPLYMITKDGKVYSKRKKGYIKIKITDSGIKRACISDGKTSKDFSINKLIKEHFVVSTTP